MVSKNIARIIDETEIVKDDIKWTTVSLSEVVSKGKRLEATVFDIDAKHARDLILNNTWGISTLKGSNGLLETAFYPGRFKRVYCPEDNGIPFFLPSQMTDIKPVAEKFISVLTKCNIEELKLSFGTILLTRSGTVGNVTLVTRTLENKVFSDDVIRIKCKNTYDIGFLYAYLKSETGSKILQTNSYGSVITHIEPEHLDEIPIPNPPKELKEKINDLVMRSFALRDESNVLIDEATQLLIDELKLPQITQFKRDLFDKNAEIDTFSVPLSKLDERTDASYHIPIVKAIIEHLQTHAKEITTIADNRISNGIILPGRFKRVYVEKSRGKVFFGGKQLYELDPSNKKYLSLTHHAKIIKEQLELKENTILITRSGTIGKVCLTPKHWNNWIANEHIIRVSPANDNIAGYLSIFLSTPYGLELIKRYTYGSVVDELDANHVSRIQIPLLKDAVVQTKINALALEANTKRYEAYLLEQKALKIMNNEIIHAQATI